MLFIRGFSILLACGLVMACGTSGRSYTSSTMQETLEIEILPNTSKMFVYRLKLADDRMPKGVRIERGGFQRGEDVQGISLGGSTKKRLSENAAYVVERMGYCQTGFLEIDSSASQYGMWLKGECKDGASEEDKKKFGTKQTLPVTLK